VLAFERERIVDFVGAERERLVPELEHLREARSSTRDFVSTSQQILQTFDQHLAARLATTVDEAGYDADIASERLNEVFSAIRATLGLVSSVVTSQGQIPEELYQVTSWFFARCAGVCESPQYVIAIDSSFYTEELQQFLRRLFTRPIGRELFEELTASFSNRPFFFIFLPASSAALSGALD